MKKDNIIKKIDAVGMLIASIKEDVSACAFVDYQQDGVFSASLELRQLAEDDLSRTLEQLRKARSVCEYITENHGIKENMDKAA